MQNLNLSSRAIGRRWIIGLVVAGLAWTQACSAPTSDAPAAEAPNPEALIEGAKKLDQQFLDAFNQRNADAMAALYWDNPEVVSFPPDAMVAQGVEAIRRVNAESFANLPADGKLELTETHYVPQGDLVLAWGMYRFTATGPDGKPIEMVGRFSDVKAERDGKWVFLMDHGSTPMMAER